MVKFGDRKELIVLIFIVLLGIFTRFINIDAQSIYIDESWVTPNTNIYYGQESIYPKIFEYQQYKNLSPVIQKTIKTVYYLHPLFQVAAIWATDVHPPLYFFLNYYWSSWFGFELDTIRTPAAIYFVITLILLIYYLKQQGIDFFTKVVILLFLIFTPLYLFFSNFARPYTLLLLLCLVSFYLSFLVIKSEFKNHRLFYILLAAACMYTHYFGVLVVASQGVYMVYEAFYARRLKFDFYRIVIIYLAIAVLYLPWFFILILQMKFKFPRLEGNSAFAYFDFKALRSIVLFFSPGYSKGSTYSGLNWIMASLQIVLFCSGLVFLFKRWASDYSRFWIFSFFGPFVLIVIFNTIKPVFTVRNCAIILIPYLCICGFGLTNIKRKYFRNSLMAFIILVGAYYTLYGVSLGDAKAGLTIESWKSVASYIDTIDDCPTIYIHHSSYRDGLYYYIKDLEKIKGLSDQQVIEGPEDGRFILIVVNHRVENIENKIKRELIFLNNGPHRDLRLIQKIAETYIYICEKS